MEQYEIDALTRIEQDPEHPRAVVKSVPLPRFRVTPPPSESDQLYSAVMGQPLTAFEKDCTAAQRHTATLQLVEVLSHATDFPELEKAAAVSGNSIQSEMLNILRKAAAELPTAVGHIPSTRPVTTPASRSPKSAARRKKLKEIFIAAGVPRTSYAEETIESLLDAMESYLDDVVG